MRNGDYHITMCTSVHVFASANAIISTEPYEHGQMSGGAVCSTNKARHGPRAQQDSDGKLTGEGSHGCRSTGPDTLVGGELMVLERLNEPSVAGWLRELCPRSKQDRQPASITNHGRSRRHTRIATSLHSSSPFDPICSIPPPNTIHHTTPLPFLLRPISTPLPTRGNSLGAMT